MVCFPLCWWFAGPCSNGNWLYRSIYLWIKPPISAKMLAGPSLQWCHNEHDGVSNHQPHGCLLDHLFRHRSKKTSRLQDTPGPLWGEFNGDQWIPAQMASNMEKISIWWHHHVAGVIHHLWSSPKSDWYTKVTSNQWTHMSMSSKYPSKYQLFHWTDLRLCHKYLETEMLSFWELKFCQWLHRCVKMTSGAVRDENFIKMTIFRYISSTR